MAQTKGEEGQVQCQQPWYVHLLGHKYGTAVVPGYMAQWVNMEVLLRTLSQQELLPLVELLCIMYGVEGGYMQKREEVVSYQFQVAHSASLSASKTVMQEEPPVLVPPSPHSAGVPVAASTVCPQSNPVDADGTPSEEVGDFCGLPCAQQFKFVVKDRPRKCGNRCRLSDGHLTACSCEEVHVARLESGSATI